MDGLRVRTRSKKFLRSFHEGFIHPHLDAFSLFSLEHGPHLRSQTCATGAAPRQQEISFVLSPFKKNHATNFRCSDRL